jgi:hypothetical protein
LKTLFGKKKLEIFGEIVFGLVASIWGRTCSMISKKIKITYLEVSKFVVTAHAISYF